MGLSPARRIARGAAALLALCVLAMGIEGALLWREQRWNETISSGQLPAIGQENLPPQVRFAQAHAQAQQGDEEAALRLYRSLELDDSPLGRAARYNGANLLMRQAALVQASAEPGKAIALIELAKEGYRDVLRGEPQHWGARYNLERAQRLLPDPDDSEAAPPDTQRDRERAATTMRGYSPGLP